MKKLLLCASLIALFGAKAEATVFVNDIEHTKIEFKITSYPSMKSLKLIELEPGKSEEEPISQIPVPKGHTRVLFRAGFTDCLPEPKHGQSLADFENKTIRAYMDPSGRQMKCEITDTVNKK